MCATFMASVREGMKQHAVHRLEKACEELDYQDKTEELSLQLEKDLYSKRRAAITEEYLRNCSRHNAVHEAGRSKINEEKLKLSAILEL